MNVDRVLRPLHCKLPFCEVYCQHNSSVNTEASSQTKYFNTAATNISDNTHMNARRYENYQNQKSEKNLKENQ